MRRSPRSEHVPALLVAASLLAATALAVQLDTYGAAVLVAPLLLAGTTLLVDRWVARQRRTVEPGPSREAWIVATAIVAASGLVCLKDPALVASFLPVLGATTAVPLLSRSKEPCVVRSRSC